MLRLWIAGGVVAALLAGAALLWRDGRQDALDQVEEKNDESGDAADGADLGYLDCIRAGRVFDFVTGECRGAEAGGGR